jgi:integrase
VRCACSAYASNQFRALQQFFKWLHAEDEIPDPMAGLSVGAHVITRSPTLAGIRYDPRDARRADADLWNREITVRGKGRKTRTVKISHDAARALDRYIRARARHAQAHRPELWLGINNRGPMTPAPAAPEPAAATTASWRTRHDSDRIDSCCRLTSPSQLARLQDLLRPRRP